MTRRQLVLHLLREAGPHRGVSTNEFLQAGCGSRYGGRVHELRAQGHVIECERIREGSFRYTLTHDAGSGGVDRGASAPAPQTQQPAADDGKPRHPAPTGTPAAASPPPSLFDANAEASGSYRDYEPEDAAA